MSILIVAATSFELQPSIRELKRLKVPTLITGVGCAISIYSITKAITQYSPSLVIQAGIGGSFDKNIALGSVRAIVEDRFGDLGVQERGVWQSVFDMGFLDANTYPFKKRALVNSHKKLLKISGLESVRAVTVNEVTTNKARIRLFKEQQAIVESMEGAALHYVALKERVPFLQIRSISNYVGERDKAKWRLQDAIDNLNVSLMHLVHQVR